MTTLQQLMRHPQIETVGYDYVKTHSNPRLYLWSYKKGKLYRLSATRPSIVTIKDRMFRTNSENWEELDYQPFNVKIMLKAIGEKKVYWLKEC